MMLTIGHYLRLIKFIYNDTTLDVLLDTMAFNPEVRKLSDMLPLLTI